MLKADVESLQWWGIDMRSRARRRVAVALTYAAFLFALWVPTRRTFMIVDILFVTQLFGFLMPSIRDAISLGWRRAMVCAALGLGVWLIWRFPARSAYDSGTAMFAVSVVLFGSVMAYDRLVDNGYRGWRARLERSGGRGAWRMQQRMTRFGFVIGLEGFACEEFGKRFKHLTEEQRAEVERLNRSYPEGKRVRGSLPIPLFDDERMRDEEDRLRARVQRVLVWVLGGSAVIWTGISTFDEPIRGETISAWAWTVFVLAITLRQAIVLWTEEDPTLMAREMELVVEEA
jgi:hypothetical protein